MRVANCVRGSSAVAIYVALFFDPRGRPGPRRRLRWRRPFLAGVGVEKLPSNDCIAARTSCCTRPRITVNKLLCLGIHSSLMAEDNTNATAKERQHHLLGILRRITLGGEAVPQRWPHVPHEHPAH